MGSSKKHKERDRKKRKRERSTSRSRDRRDKHHRHHKHKKHKRSREERSPSITLSDISDVEGDFVGQRPAEEPVRPTRRFAYSPPPLSPTLTPPREQPNLSNEEVKGGEEISISIEETNKIRIKLGLKPLDVKPEIRTVKNEEEQITKDGEYKAGEILHKPAENLRDKLKVEKLREKIAAQKEKRLQAKRLTKIKTLGQSDDEANDSAAAWVKKSRIADKERREAEKRNKMLEDLDAQFGVGDLVEEEITQTKKKMYDSHNLSGLKVQHDTGRFSDGQTTILTLMDSNILDGGEDTLVNVNIEDMERVEKNLKRKRTKINEVDYDAPEVDEFGDIVHQELLTKYDEEIGGERKKSFRIGRGGEGFRPKSDAEKKVVKMSKLRQLASLDTPTQQLATEYLTTEEVSFKKVKNKKKKKMFTADDLEPLEDSEQHWGSRNRYNEGIRDNQGDEGVETVPTSNKKVLSLRELTEEEETGGAEVNDVPMEDAADSEGEKDAIELQEALARSRRAKLNAKKPNKNSDNPVPGLSLSTFQQDDLGAMTLNLTDEFCRSLGDIPTYGLSGNRAEDDAVLPDEKSLPTSGDSLDKQGGTWAEVNIEEHKVEIENDRGTVILEEEPDTGIGVVNALKLAIKKGYLEKDNNKKLPNATLHHLKAINYSIDDKAGEDERRSGRGGGGSERYMGPTMDFREKDSYKPDVKLDYVDDEGRKLNAKEAFRYLSHKFHGKGSGKNKLEKRMKKWQEELLMKHMSSSDTPLQTLEKQREKQKQMGTAYLILSGNMSQETLDVKK